MEARSGVSRVFEGIRETTPLEEEPKDGMERARKKERFGRRREIADLVDVARRR